ncbi:MAG: hypothetical protein K2X77_09100 [Candidatus Obscuribacterales bacterium]|nr:hypothetical protein [Candidatus Obscuribacterales bacterium]
MNKLIHLLLLSFLLNTFIPASSESDKGIPTAEVKEITDFVEYVNSKKLRSSYSPAVSLFWTADEIKQVERIISWIGATCPGLLRLASADHLLSLVRVKEINVFHGNRISHAVATSEGDNCIYISDKFFTRDDKLWVLLHEFVHAADDGCYVAYSKDFVDFAGPTILEARKSTSSLAHLKDSRYFNLKESLAYGVAGSFQYRSAYIPKSIGAELVMPSVEHMLWRKAYSKGKRYFENKTWEFAIKEFSKAAKISENAPLCHYYLGLCFHELKQEKKSAEEFLNSVQQFEKLEVPIFESNRTQALYCYALQLRQVQDYDKAALVLQKILPYLMGPELNDAKSMIFDSKQKSQNKAVGSKLLRNK